MRQCVIDGELGVAVVARVFGMDEGEEFRSVEGVVVLEEDQCPVIVLLPGLDELALVSASEEGSLWSA
jgi:hypothetical protein